MTYEDLIGALFPLGAPTNFADHALILSLDLVLAMKSAQDQVGSQRHKVQPAPTTDGRFLIGADILPELAPGKLFAPAMEHFDPTSLDGIEVLPWADGVALLPNDEVDL